MAHRVSQTLATSWWMDALSPEKADHVVGDIRTTRRPVTLVHFLGVEPGFGYALQRRRQL